MKKTGLLAAFLLSVGLAGSNVLASNKASTKTGLKDRIERQKLDTVNTSFEAKGVKEIKVLNIREALTDKAESKAFTNRWKQNVFATERLAVTKKITAAKVNAKHGKKALAKGGRHWEQKHHLC